MSEVKAPINYQAKLNRYQLQAAIDFIHTKFQEEISTVLGLQRVSAPLFVSEKSGLNDGLSGLERAVSFEAPALGETLEVVHSLAKWKRKALKDYGFKLYEGLFTNMNAIRKEEILDNTHSIYVDQWDWEKIISTDDLNEAFLREIVQQIANIICNVNHLLRSRFPVLKTELVREVSFITAQELEDKYPDLSPEERENEYTREHKTVFIIGIGDKLRSGKRHGDRAPDYDNWELNGDLLYWHEPLNEAMELSSMGIRVDAQKLIEQLEKSQSMDKISFPYHQALVHDKLPQTIGGGIGQSRLCMLLIGTAHIGEVQSSIWDDDTLQACESLGIPLL